MDRFVCTSSNERKCISELLQALRTNGYTIFAIDLKEFVDDVNDVDEDGSMVCPDTYIARIAANKENETVYEEFERIDQSHDTPDDRTWVMTEHKVCSTWTQALLMLQYTNAAGMISVDDRKDIPSNMSAVMGNH